MSYGGVYWVVTNQHYAVMPAGYTPTPHCIRYRRWAICISDILSTIRKTEAPPSGHELKSPLKIWSHPPAIKPGHALILFSLIQSGAEKNVDHRAICEHHLRKLLLSSGFVLVECRWQIWRRWRINILCNIVCVKYFYDVIRDVMFSSDEFDWSSSRTVATFWLPNVLVL